MESLEDRAIMLEEIYKEKEEIKKRSEKINNENINLK